MRNKKKKEEEKTNEFERERESKQANKRRIVREKFKIK